MPFWKSKFFWLNIIGLIINIGQYFITNNLAPNYTILITSIIGILQIIANSLAGLSLSNQNAKLKASMKG
jgi:hypothetical protein